MPGLQWNEENECWKSKGTPVWKVFDNKNFVSAVMANHCRFDHCRVDHSRFDHCRFDPHAQAQALNTYLQSKGFNCEWIKLKENHMGFPCAEVRIFNTADDSAFDAAFKEIESFNKTWKQVPAAATPSPATPLSPTAEEYVPTQGGAAAAAATPAPRREIPGYTSPAELKKIKKAEKKAAQAAAASAASATSTPSTQTDAGAAAAADSSDGFKEVQSKAQKKATAAAAGITGKSFAGAAKQGVASAAASTPTSSVPTGGAAAETDLQRLERLKKEHEEIAKRQREIQDAIKQAEAAVKQNDSKSLEDMIAFAATRGDEFMQGLLEGIQSRMPRPAAAAAAAPVQADGAAAATDTTPAQTAAASATDGDGAAPTAAAKVDEEKKEETRSAWCDEPENS